MEGIWDLSFRYAVNLKILPTATKTQNHFATFLGMKYYVKQAMNDL